MIIKRVNIWSIEPIFCSNYIPSSKTEMTKNNKSVLFLGGKVCVSLAHRVQTHGHSSSWAQSRSRLQIPTLQSSIWLESRPTLDGGTIGEKLQNNQLLFLDFYLCTSYLFVNQTNDSPDRNCSYCVIC